MNEPIDFEWPKTEFTNILRWEDDGGQACKSCLPEINKPKSSSGIRSAQIPPTVILSILIERRRNLMNKRVGMWLDEDKAVIVSITENGEGTRIFTSDMEHYVRYSGVVPGDGEPEDPRDRRFWNHIGEYYDKLIAHIRDAKAIQIIGPGEAKHELKKRLLLVGLMENMVSTENADKMTDHQVALIVRARFPVRSQFDLSTS